MNNEERKNKIRNGLTVKNWIDVNYDEKWLLDNFYGKGFCLTCIALEGAHENVIAKERVRRLEGENVQFSHCELNTPYYYLSKALELHGNTLTEYDENERVNEKKKLESKLVAFKNTLNCARH